MAAGWIGIGLIGCAHSGKLSSSSHRGIAHEPNQLTQREQAFQFYQMGQFDRAIALFEILTRTDAAPEIWDRYLLAYSLVAVGDLPYAVRLSTHLVHEQPLQTVAYELLGLAQLLSGDLANAEQNLRRAAKLEGTSAKVHFQLGQIGVLRGQPQEAQQEFSLAERDLKASSGFKELYELASLYVFSGEHLDDVPELIERARKAIRGVDEDDLPHERALLESYHLPFLEAVYAAKVGKEGAEFQLAELLQRMPGRLLPDQSEIAFYLGLCFQKKRDLVTARSYFEWSEQLLPKGIYARLAERQRRALQSRK